MQKMLVLSFSSLLPPSPSPASVPSVGHLFLTKISGTNVMLQTQNIPTPNAAGLAQEWVISTLNENLNFGRGQ